ncbi:MAG: tubulin/FtsZ family protein [Halobacteriota archaeon]
MKAALVGLGQAGGQIAEAIRDADRQAGYGAVRGVLAVNTARPDLAGLDVDTMLIGQDRVAGHGVGADNELGAEIMDADRGEVLAGLDGIITAETDAVVLVAGLGGGTGSGAGPVLARELKRIYDQPIYGLGILPGRDEGALYQKNAGQSLKTFAREADSLLLVENDAWRQTDESVAASFRAINEKIARRLDLLFAAGEAVEGVGESVVDASEVINTLRPGDMAAVGYAAADAAPDPGENVNVITSTARRALLTGMSVPETTRGEAALVLVAGDPDRLPRKGIERARQWIESETGTMAVRGGDLPIRGDRIAVVVILSGIAGSPRLQSFMERATAASQTVEEQTDRSNAFQNDELEDLF